MQLVQIKLRLLSRRLSFCLLNSLNYSLERENLGEEYCCMAHQVLVNLTWLKHVLLRLMEHSSVYPHQILFQNGLESLRDQLSNYLSQLERINQLLYSQMRQIHFVEVEVRVKMKLAEELKLSSSYRCKVLEMIMMEYWYLELAMSLGNLIQLLEEDLRRESIFPFQIFMQDQPNLKSELEKLQIISVKMTSQNQPRQPKAIQDPISQSLSKKH